MTFLCLEGSTDEWSVAVISQGNVLSLRNYDRQSPMASKLAVAIREVMQESGLSWKDLSAVTIASGPGSYTGLRIIASTAKGLCFGTGLPLIAIPSLLSLAWDGIYSNQFDNVISVIDARRQDVFCAIYNSRGEEIMAPALITLTDHCFDSFLDGKVMVCGNGIAKIDGYIWAPNLVKGPPQSSAISLFKPASKAYTNQNFENLAAFSPFYLLPPNITQSKK